MKLLNEIIVAIHLLGMAAIIGGWLAVRQSPRMVPSILWGARVQLATGIILAGLASMDKEDPPNNAKLAVKLLVALVVVWLSESTWVAQKKAAASAALTEAGSKVTLVGGLAVLNVLIAVLWRSYS
jgi:hypothetical protein